jgi:hypothetical protein
MCSGSIRRAAKLPQLTGSDKTPGTILRAGVLLDQPGDNRLVVEFGDIGLIGHWCHRRSTPEAFAVNNSGIPFRTMFAGSLGLDG